MIIVLRVISVYRSFRPEDKILRICNLVMSKEIPLVNLKKGLGVKCSWHVLDKISYHAIGLFKKKLQTIYGNNPFKLLANHSIILIYVIF